MGVWVQAKKDNKLHAFITRKSETIFMQSSVSLCGFNPQSRVEQLEWEKESLLNETSFHSSKCSKCLASLKKLINDDSSETAEDWKQKLPHEEDSVTIFQLGMKNGKELIHVLWHRKVLKEFSEHPGREREILALWMGSLIHNVSAIVQKNPSIVRWSLTKPIWIKARIKQKDIIFYPEHSERLDLELRAQRNGILTSPFEIEEILNKGLEEVE